MGGIPGRGAARLPDPGPRDSVPRMTKPRELGTVGEWTYHDHRMARFENRQVFSWVAAMDNEGTRWSWVVMLPGRDPSSRTTGEAATGLQAAQAADAVGREVVTQAADPEAVERWALEHLRWRTEVDKAEIDATHSWDRGSAD